MIHVCFCFHDKTGRYAKFAGTAILSLFENTTSAVTVHILHDNTLTADNADKFSYLVGHYGQLVKFYNLDKLCPDKIGEIISLVPEVGSSKVTVGAFYKLLIPQILPKEIDKAIFIDPDTIINLDINELWQIELGDKVLGVVPGVENGTDCNKVFRLCKDGTVKGTDYFNTGVLLMNLNILRDKEDAIMEGVKFRGKNPEHKFFEQTVLNYCFSTQTVKLTSKFNLFVRNARKNKKQRFGGKIFHYVDGSSRMGLDMSDFNNRLWMDYFIKTPWFNEDALGQLYFNLQKIRNDSKESALKLSTIVSGKARVFFIDPKKVTEMKKIFSIRDEEEIILAENEDSIKKLIDSMKESSDKKIFVITTEKFQKKDFPFDRLNKAGFKEDKNFLKAWKFFPNAQNVLSESYALIEAM